MARFKGGDLILNATKKVKIGTAEISDNASTLQINKPLKADGIQLNSGYEITSTSTYVGEDSTASLIPSTTVREKMTEATSTISGGTDAVGVVLQPRPDIVASQIVYAANGLELDTDMSGWDITTMSPIDIYGSSITGTALKSGLIACFYLTDPGGLKVEYLTQDETSVNVLSILSSYGTSIEPRSYIAGALSGGGCVIEAASSSDDKAYLIGVNAGCDIVVTEELPYDLNRYYTFGILPNDDIFIASSPDGTSLYWARYRLDLLDSTSFITVTDWEDTGYDLSSSSFTQGAYCRYLGENRVVIPVDAGFIIFNIQTKEVEATGTVTGVDDPYSICEITTDKKIMIFAVSNDTNTLNMAVFTDTGIELENGITVSTSYLGSIPGTTVLLPNGNVALFFRQTELGYYIIDQQGEEVSSGQIDISGSSPNAFVSMIPDGKLLIQHYNTDFYNSIINPPSIKFSNLGGYEGSSLSYPQVDSLQPASTIQDAIKYSKFPEKSPINIQGQVDGRDVGDNWVTSYATYSLGTGSNSGLIMHGVFTSLRKAAVFYCSSSAKNDSKCGIIDLDTMEIQETDIGIPAGKTVESGNNHTLLTKDKYMVVYFRGNSSGTDSWVKTVDINGNSITSDLLFDAPVYWAGELETGEILFIQYYSSPTRYKYSRYRIDVDSSSFVHISSVEAVGSLAGASSTYFQPIYDLGDGELLLTSQAGGRVQIVDINGNKLKDLDAFSLYSISNSDVAFSNNLIYLFGRDSNNNPKCVVLDRDLNLIKSTVDTDFELTLAVKDKEVLPNGTCLFSVYDSVGATSSYIFFVTPDGNFTYKIFPVLKINSVLIQHSIYNLGNGDFITIGGYFPDYKNTVITFFEKEPVDDRLIFHKTIAPQSNYGAYDYRPVKYTKEIIFYDTGTDSEKKTIGVFNSGRIVVFENVSSKMVYSILKSDGEIVVDRAELFLGTYTSNANTRIDENDKRSVHSFNNISYVLATFKDQSTGQRVTIVIDDEGNQPCYPMMHLNNDPSMYGVSSGILEDDRIIITENSTSGYEMGDGQYLSMWEVNTDSSAFEVVIPRIKQFERRDESDLVQITKNRVVYYGSDELSLLNTKNLGVTCTYENPCSGRTVRLREIVVTPNKRIVILCYTVNSATDVDFYARIFRYDDYNEQLIYEKETFLFTSQTEYDPISMVLNNDWTIAIYCTNINHIDPIASNRGKGILLMDETGDVLNADDYITYNNTSWINLPVLERGADGALYVIKTGSTETILEKWMPVITKESPFRSVAHVVTTTDSTTLIDIDKLGVQTIYTGTGTHTVTVPSFVLVNEIPIGFHCTFGRTSSGSVTFETDGGGASIISADSNVDLRTSGSTAKLIKVAHNVWLLTGDLA